MLIVRTTLEGPLQTFWSESQVGSTLGYEVEASQIAYGDRIIFIRQYSLSVVLFNWTSGKPEK